MAHTKGKLHLHDMEPATICAEDHISIADCNARRRLEEENHANAAHLVHCWNFHDQLVESLRWAMEHLNRRGTVTYESSLEDALRVLEEAQS